MLALPQVTLVCADTLNHALALRAIERCVRLARFGRVVFLTDALPAGLAAPPAVEIVRIAPLASRDDYSRLMLKSLAQHVATTHALVVQWDGYVVNPGAWTDEFLACDYIGAPWYWQPEGRRVGNGGFSLRSSRLLAALADARVVLEGNEDETIGVAQRGWLEAAHGIRFADEALAHRFSFEAAHPVGRPFGFHGLFNLARVESEPEIVAIAPMLTDAIARSPQCVSLLRNCLALQRWTAAEAIAARIVAAGGEHAAEASAARSHAGAARRQGVGVGRNDPCPCGSGRRYKQCHGAAPAAARTATADAVPSTAPPADADTLVRAGMAAHEAGRLDEARRSYERALAARPDHPYAGHYLGVLDFQRGAYPEAIARLEAAARARPGEPDFQVNLGLAYAAANRLEDACAAQRRAIELAPRSPVAWNNLGLALHEQNRHDDAVDAYDRALALDPRFARARWNRAMSRLARGDRGGWDDYESRLAIPELGGAFPDPGVPRWTGDDPAGRTILVDAEQGYGDTLQFIRYAKPLADRGARVVVRTQAPLARLVATAPGVAGVVDPGELPVCDAWLPLVSLAAWAQASPQGGPPDPPYLHADPDLVDAAKARLARVPARWKIGLSWAGNPAQANNRRRSCPLAALAPLLERVDIAWYSLQRIDGEDEIASVPAARALRLPDDRNDFDRKAALVCALDLVISVCTSNAHLAGALGRRPWILLTHAPDWRWGPSGTTSAWYPGARLFRQPALGDWAAVVAGVGTALDRLETDR